MNERDASGGEPAAPEQKPERGRGIGSQAEAITDRYKEIIGLLQQFANEGLARLIERRRARLIERPEKVLPDLSPQSMVDFAEYKDSRGRGEVIQIRVPGRDEAKELQNTVRDALGLGDDEQNNPLQRQKRGEERKGKPTYMLFLRLSKLSPDQITRILERALKHLGVQPNWEAHFTRPDRKAEFEFARTRRTIERDAEKARGTGDPKIDDGLTTAERIAKRRLTLEGPGGPIR